MQRLEDPRSRCFTFYLRLGGGCHASYSSALSFIVSQLIDECEHTGFFVLTVDCEG